MNKEKVLRNFALANAIKFEGQAKIGTVIGSAIQAYPDWKKDIVELKRIAASVVEAVNALSVPEQIAELEQNAPELLEKKEAKPRPELKPLPGSPEYGKVVMRFEPSPSGALHAGHCVPLLLNHAYCQEYQGKLILRISDTNPDNIAPEAYELIEKDANWVTSGGISEVVVQSDRMEIYYAHALTLLEEGHAYVCTCSSEDFRSLLQKQMACPCRDKSAESQVKLWKQMLTTMPEGDGVVRMKTDLRHKNPALRDFPLLRINENEHPRVKDKYRVWPLMNFAVTIDDHDLGLTHVLRGKDHLDNTRRQMYLYDAFGWTPPEFIHIGRVNFHGLRLSASETQKRIREGYYTGWDDIQLPFLPAYRRRGFLPEAFLKFVKSLGVTMVDKSVEAGEFQKSLCTFNRELIDPAVDRQFFIKEPKEAIIIGAPKKTVELDLHPDLKQGGRVFSCDDKYLLGEESISAIKDGQLVRLMDNLNFVRKGADFHYVSDAYEDWKDKGGLIIHWLPAGGPHVPIRLRLPDESVRLGAGEPSLGTQKVGTTVQLERICFATYQGEIDGMHEYWYLHR